MKFGPCQVDDALDAILGHSVLAGSRRIRKGTVLCNADLNDLGAAKIGTITVARLEPGDIHEDAAALKLAEALVKNSKSTSIGAPFTGRVNIFAERDGLFRVDAGAITAFNSVDPSITVATLADHCRVEKGTLLATVKIIPFATSQENLDRAGSVASGVINVARFVLPAATLILTELPDTKKSLQDKGIRAVANRMQSIGCDLGKPFVVPHKTDELVKALKEASDELVLILTSSATSDENDVGPAALKSAGGKLTRFGMPVDPGNLLFLGQLGSKTVVGLPGCVRSPALNGADWVLERLACGIEVTDADIADMGVGGLLKEIPTRTQPRSGIIQAAKRPRIEVILLAAGAPTLSQGVDKLMEDVGGETLLHHSAKLALGANVDDVIVVLPPENEERMNSLADVDVKIVEAPDWRNGMAASIGAGLSAISKTCDAVIIAHAGTQNVTSEHLNRLIAGFDPSENREICRSVPDDGKPGTPVLFGRRFFESLATLAGDLGGRDIIRQAKEYTIDVQTNG